MLDTKHNFVRLKLQSCRFLGTERFVEYKKYDLQTVMQS